MAEWNVPYRVTYRGTAEVEADTAEQAWELVEAGDFEDQPGQERVDWEAMGAARKAQ